MICTVCYGNRPQAKRIPIGMKPETPICTGCAIDIDKVLGYMALNGHGFMFNMDGTLHIVDLMTGESWTTIFKSVAAAGVAMAETEHKGGDAPPTPSSEPSDPKVQKPR